MGEGLSGLGLYWCIVEMLYENGGYIELDLIPTIAYELRTTEEQIHSVISKYDLFSKNKAKFWSDGVLKRLKTRNDKSEKARQNASARWDKNKGQKEECDGNAMAMQWQCDRNANAMQTLCKRNATAMRQECDRNAIKEKKRKEKEIKEDNNIYSKQASNLKKEDNNNACACESVFVNEDYDDLLDGFGVYGEYRNAIFRFIAHLKVNFNKVMMNERLENLIITLDRLEEEYDRVKMIDDAILKGYQRLECEV